MKKVLAILMIMGLLVSCGLDMQLADSDGFYMYQFGWQIAEDAVMVQSHDGFVINDKFDTETVFSFTEENPKLIVENRLDHPIDVRFTSVYAEIWVGVEAGSAYEFILVDE